MRDKIKSAEEVLRMVLWWSGLGACLHGLSVIIKQVIIWKIPLSREITIFAWEVIAQ